MRRLLRLLSLGICATAFLMASPLLPTALAGPQGTPKDPGLPSDAGIQPVWVPGSPTCVDLAPEGQTWRGVAAGPATGPYGDGLLDATISLQQAMGGQTLGWEANLSLSAVLVHAASDTNLYRYDPAVGVTSDTFLHAPVELDSPTFMAVESVSLCYAPPPQDPGLPSGSGVQPVWMPGGSTCADLAPAGSSWQELYVDPAAEGSYEDGALRISIRRTDSLAGQSLDWWANAGVDAVLVHDGRQSNVYTYNPPLAATADTGLHAPLEPGTALLRPLASVSFCYTPQPPDPGPPSEQGVQPQWWAGSPGCAALAPAGVTWSEFAVGPVDGGTYGDGLLSVDLDRHDLMGGQTVDWAANLGVDAVLVRSGSDTNVYTYRPPAALKADAGLHAPIGADMLVHQMDEIAFCYQVPPHDPGPPSAEGVQPVWRNGNPTCDEIAPPGSHWRQLTVEPVAGGTYSDGYLTLQLGHERPMGGEVLAWSSNAGVSAILVQGGGNSNLYSYLPAGSQDSQLHAAVDPGTNLFYAMERVGFCYEQAPEDPGIPSENGTQPVWKPGDQSCASLAPAGTAWRELRVEPVASGTFSDGLLAVTLEAKRGMGGPSVDWSTGTGIDAVWVAGETNGNLYQYEPPAEASFDTFLHAPVGQSLVLQEIRYLSFCYDASPSIAVELSGDTVARIGDSVTYNVHISNDGDLPLHLVSVVDALIGDLTVRAQGAGCGSLSPGTSCSFQTVRHVAPGDPDPLRNSVTVTYSLDEGGAVEAQDEHTTDLFQAAIAAAVAGPELAMVGDPIDYMFTLSNNSSAGAPPMVCTADTTLNGRIFDGVLPRGDTVLQLRRTAQPADPNPLPNVVALNCSLDGFPDSYHAEAALSTGLYAPSISLTQMGDNLAYAGYQASYSIVLRNESPADTPPLDCALTNSSLGFAKQVTLNSGQEDLSLVSYIIPQNAPDPFVSTVTATCLALGAQSPVTAAASWSTELFQARIDLSKTGDVLSRRGDTVDYQIVLENRSSPDTPDLECTLTDPLLDLVRTVTLSSGAAYPIAAAYQVPAGADDPLANLAAVNCKTTGFPQTLVDQASHSTQLFEPAIALVKTGPVRSHIGDSVSYTITLRNDSSANTPDLACMVSDPMLGLSEPVTLASGDSRQLFVSGYAVPADAQDPFVNTATAACSPAGYSGVLRAEDSWSVDLFQPSIELEKTGDAFTQPGGSVDYTISLRNASSTDTPDLACTISDSLLQVEEEVALAPDEVYTLVVPDHAVPADAHGAYTNVATAHCTPVGFGTAIDAEATWITELYSPALLVIVDGPAYARVGEKVTYSFYIRNTSSPNTPALDLVDVVDDKLGDLTQLAEAAGCATLVPGDGTSGHCQFTVRYTVQPGDERGRDPAGWPTLVNTVVARYLPRGMSSEVTGSDTHSLALLQPSASLAGSSSAPSDDGPAPVASAAWDAVDTPQPARVATVIPAFLALYTCLPPIHPSRALQARTRRGASHRQRAPRRPDAF